jgi:uracil-DNA glycosylase
MQAELDSLLVEIRQCRECEAQLPHGPRPILAASVDSRILIIGQAPGSRVHETGIAWNDPSGERLRSWMGISSTDFYDPSKVAIVPMGFCCPGTGPGGDLPPRPECAPLWHGQLLKLLGNVQLTLVMGRYAQAYRLNTVASSTLTETVKRWRDRTPDCLPLPHPSPRNNRWLKNNPWFLEDVVPYLKRRIRRVLR